MAHSLHVCVACFEQTSTRPAAAALHRCLARPRPRATPCSPPRVPARPARPAARSWRMPSSQRRLPRRPLTPAPAPRVSTLQVCPAPMPCDESLSALVHGLASSHGSEAAAPRKCIAVSYSGMSPHHLLMPAFGMCCASFCLISISRVLIAAAAPASLQGHPIALGSGSETGSAGPGSPSGPMSAPGSVQGHPVTFDSGSELGSPLGSTSASPLSGSPIGERCICTAPMP